MIATVRLNELALVPVRLDHVAGFTDPLHYYASLIGVVVVVVNSMPVI